MRTTYICALMMTLSLLAGCSAQLGHSPEETAQAVRTHYLSVDGCTGSARLRADYGRRVYDYTLTFTAEREGETVLTLSIPEHLAGVTAHIGLGETALEYDGLRLETGPLSPQGLAPIDGLPRLLTALREGYLAEIGLEEADGTELLRMTSRDPEASPGAGEEVVLWVDPVSHSLVRGEISADGFTVLTCEIEEFSFLELE